MWDKSIIKNDLAGSAVNTDFYILRRFRGESVEVFRENNTWRRDKFEVTIAFYDYAIRSYIIGAQIFCK